MTKIKQLAMKGFVQFTWQNLDDVKFNLLENPCKAGEANYERVGG